MNLPRLIALAMTLAACGSACRAGEVTVTGPATATPGGVVTVSVTLSGDLNNVYALQGALAYDSAILTPLPDQAAAAPQSFFAGSVSPFPGETIPKDADLFRMNAAQLGTLVFGYVKNPSNPAGSPSSVVPTTALRFSFNVSPSATGSTTIQLNPYEVNGQSLTNPIVGGIDSAPLDASAGAPLVISFRLPGDVNGDSTVTLDDVAKALLLAAGLETATQSQAGNGDVSPLEARDGMVTLLDAVQILRFVAGLDTVLN